ncbi:homeobox-leucine zipper protein ATHB-52-like [Impatiens glandulifera]|uniref:homeobox-leucine zipper protein ATHB-52-like n=1 Tax=Impatiens glandulifera TaxID=253017 RepID=UPI001FB16B83|nr:homeobox-leucine zipper protein ATHB-52-like [Impatiens glandulifera]
MTFFNSQNNQKSHSFVKQNNKKRLTLEQVSHLEKSFDSYKKLDPNHKLELALELGVPARQIAIWYQNRRARWRTQSLEIDYSSLQSRLETALAEKKKLEKETERLRIELGKAQQMVVELKQGGNINNSSYYEEGGSSNICSLNDELSRPIWEDIDDQHNEGSLQFQELLCMFDWGRSQV